MSSCPSHTTSWLGVSAGFRGSWSFQATSKGRGPPAHWRGFPPWVPHSWWRCGGRVHLHVQMGTHSPRHMCSHVCRPYDRCSGTSVWVQGVPSWAHGTPPSSCPHALRRGGCRQAGPLGRRSPCLCSCRLGQAGGPGTVPWARPASAGSQTVKGSAWRLGRGGTPCHGHRGALGGSAGEAARAP